MQTEKITLHGGITNFKCVKCSQEATLVKNNGLPAIQAAYCDACKDKN